MGNLTLFSLSVPDAEIQLNIHLRHLCGLRISHALRFMLLHNLIEQHLNLFPNVKKIAEHQLVKILSKK